MVTAPLAALLLAAAGAAPAAAPAGVGLLRDFTIALPPGAATRVRLLVPPLPEAAAARLPPGAPRFAAGPAGATGDAVWLAVEPDLLVQATRGFRLRPGVPIADLAVLEGGGLVVTSGDAVGFLVPEPPEGAATAGRVTFQPIAELPITEARLAAAAGGGLYLFGPAREGGGQAVYLLAPEPAGTGPDAPRALRTLRRVFSTSERIAAVAGDGRETFVATGKLVVKVSSAAPGLTPVVLHPRSAITGLALTRRGLLFYATAAGAGVAAPAGAVEFVQAPGLSIRASGDALYLLLRDSLAVVKVEGTEPFRNAAAPAARAN